jgi:hypothetical protein
MELLAEIHNIYTHMLVWPASAGHYTTYKIELLLHLQGFTKN